MLNNPAAFGYRPDLDVWAYNDGAGSVTNETTGTPTVMLSLNGDGISAGRLSPVLGSSSHLYRRERRA